VKLLFLFGLVAVVATCGHQNKRHHSAYHGQRVYHGKATELILVDPDWIEDYHRLEKKFKYPIAADRGITPRGKQFKVNGSILDHYNDLQRTEATAGN
jgi:hypothetical protein